MSTKRNLLLAAAVGLAAWTSHSQVPGLLSHQGRLTVHGTNFTGTAQFKFALVNAPGDTTFWSHDGTGAGGAEPTGPAVALPVSRGVFAVNLGDVAVPNMLQVIPANLFTNPEVYLRIWVDDGQNGSQRLTPDRRIAAAGYALAAGSLLGPVSEAQLPTNAARLNRSQTFAGVNLLTNAANQFAGTFTGDGSGLTNLTASIMSVLSTNLTGPAGGDLTGNYPNPLIASGVIGNAHVSASANIAGTKIAAATTGARGTVVLAADGQTAGNVVVQGNDQRLANNLKTTGGLLTGGLTNTAGFFGDGAGLSNLIARSLLGAAPSATNFSGSLAGDVTGGQAATVVSQVGGVSAANVASGANAANAATSVNTPSTIVQRDASGNFAAGTVTATFAGGGAGLTNLNASHLASGTVADGRLSTNVALLNAHLTWTGSNTLAGVARLTNESNFLVGTHAGDGTGLSNLTARSLLGAAPSATNFSGPLAGDVTGGQTTTVVSQVGGVSAANVAAGANAANAAASLNAPSTIIQRDASGNFAAGTITAAFVGNGAALTNLDASSLASGTLADARLSGRIPRLEAAQSFSGANVFANPSNWFTGTFTGDGSGLTNLSATIMSILSTNLTGPAGGDLTGNFPNPLLATGAVTDTHISGTAAIAGSKVTAATTSARGTVTLAADGQSDASVAVQGNDRRLANNLKTTGGTLTGPLTNQAGLYGDGSGLSNVTATALLAPAPSATNFSGGLAGDVTGTQTATVVASVGGVGAANLAAGAVAANAATSSATANTLVRRDASGNFVAGTITATFAGNGAALTNLDASGLASGTLADARLSTNAALRDAHQTFSGSNTFTGVARLTHAANVLVGILAGDGAGLSNLTAVALLAPAPSATNFSGSLAGDVTGTQAATVVASVGGISAADVATGAVAANAATSSATASTLVRRDASGNFNAATISATFAGNGAALTNLDAASLASGTLADARLSANAALRDAHQTFTGSNTFTGVARLTNAANVLVGTVAGDGSGLSNLTAAALLAPAPSATNFSGSLAGDVTGTQAATVVASVGGVTAADVASGAAAGNSATSASAANTLVRRDASGNFNAGTITATFAGNGAALTNLDASSLASGTLADARLSGRIPRLEAAQSFSGANVFANPSNWFTGSFTGDGSGLTNLSATVLSLLSTNLTGPAGGDLTGNFPNPLLAVGAVTDAHISGAAAIAGSKVAAASTSARGTVTLAADGQSEASVAVQGNDSRLANNLKTSGGTLTGPLTNQAGFYGDGAGLSNLTAVALLAPAPSATNFSGSLTGDVTGTQTATVVASVGGLTAAEVASGAAAGNAATSASTANTLVRRDASGNFNAGTITATFAGAGAALTNLDASGLTAGTLADARLSANAALRNAHQTFTGSNTFTGVARLTNVANVLVGTLVGDGSGLSNITATALRAPAPSATNFSGSLAGDVTGTQAATVVGSVGGVTAADVASGAVAAKAATSSATADTLVRRDASGNFNAGTITATFAGNGAALTNLDASSLASGTLADARLSGRIPRLEAAQSFSGANVFANPSNWFTGSFTGDGSGLTNLSATVMSLLSTNLTGPAGGDLTGNFPNPLLAVGAVTDAHISGTAAIAGSKVTAATTSARGTVTLAADGQSETSVAVQGNDSRLANNLKTSGGTLTGPLTNQAGFYGDGSGLSNLTAAALLAPAPSATNFSGSLAGDVTGTQAATVVASVGGVSAADVATGAVAANAATSSATADTLVRRDISGSFNAGTITASFAGNGAALTNLDASGLTAGTMADARLSTNAALRDAHQTFSGTNTFTGVALLTNVANVLVGTLAGDGSGLSNLTAAALHAPAPSATNFSGSLAGDVTGTQAATVVASVGGVSAVNVATGAVAAKAATSSATADTLVRRDASGNFNAGTITASFAGNGAALTNLDASGLASGTLADARLSGRIPRLETAQTFSGANVFANPSNWFTGSFTGDGSGLTNLSASVLSLLSTNLTGPAGGDLTGNFPNPLLAAGTVTDTHISGTAAIAGSKVTAATTSARGTVTLATDGQSDASVAVQGNDRRLANNLKTSGGTLTGPLTNEAGFYGDGAGLSNLIAVALLAPAPSATNFSGSLAGDVTGTQTATVVASVGGVTAADVASGAAAGNTATSASTVNALVRRDASGNFSAAIITASFAGNGAALTNLDASSLAAGTVADVRLSANAALRDAHQTFTGSNTFTGVARLTNAANVLVGTVAGDGSGLSNLTAAALLAPAPSATNFSGSLAGDVTGTQAATVVASVGGVSAADVASGAVAANAATSSATTATLVRRDASGNFNAGTISATFAGNGAALTNLDASSLAAGTVADVRLSANAALRDAPQTFSGSNTFTGVARLTNAANVLVGTLAGDGSGLSNITAVALRAAAPSATNFSGSLAGDVTGTQTATVVASVGGATAANIASGVEAANAATSSATADTLVRRDGSGNFLAGTITATFAGNGAALTNLDAASLASGTLADARLSTNTALRDAHQTFGGSNTFTGVARLTNAANVLVGTVAGDGSGLSNITAVALRAPAPSATNFSGSLAGDVTGTQAATVVASVGGVTAADVASGAAAGNTATSASTANTLVRRDASGNFNAGTITATFAGNGAALTNLNATNLAAGTLADARLSANVARLDAAQTFSGANVFTHPSNRFSGSFSGDGSGLANLPAPRGTLAVSLSGQDSGLVSTGYRLTMTIPAPAWVNGATSNAPSARLGHTAIWDGQEMVIWGGSISSSSYASSGGLYHPDADTWTTMSTLGAPAARAGHTAVWSGTEMIVWGGFSSAGDLRTGGRFVPEPQAWTSMATSGAPAERSGHIAVWTGSRMLVWGGLNNDGFLDDGALYDPVANQWTALTVPNPPEARSGATAVWTGDQLVVWGGQGAGGELDSGGQLLFVNGEPTSWQPLSLENAPSARSGHSAVWTGDLMLVWGGQSGGTVLGDGAALSALSNTWTPLSSTNAPAARTDHAAVWTGSEMLILDGSSGAGELSTGAAYDPITLQWRSLSKVGGPLARTKTAAVWSGTEVLLFGGQAAGQRVAAPQRLVPQPVWYFYRKL